MSAALDLPVVLLSHRGPVSFDAAGAITRGAGGLVTALTGLTGHLDDAVWVCVAGEHDPSGPLRLGLDPEPRALGDGDDADGRVLPLRLVDIPTEVHQPFYGAIANPLLWFVQHRLYGIGTEPSLGREHRRAWDEGYVTANRLAAEAVLQEVERHGGKAAVLLHDYHFYLVGQLVRDAFPDVLISHFVHIPWPGPDAWKVLPPDIRTSILTGLLGCDVVAFHTRSDARSFLLCVQELLGFPVDLDEFSVQYGERTVRARAYPISIDIPSLQAIAHSPAADEHLAELDRGLGDAQLVLRVDRTDPSKNIVRGFAAFGLLLDEHPELAGQVVFLALLQPSRQDVQEYADYTDAIHAAAGAVNARHGTDDWTPVDLRLVSDMPLAAAAYRRCDVLVVNAVADGMNLVAKEAVVVNERDMVLALSEATGAHDELGRFALTLHPFDVAQQSDALHAALTMSASERADRRGMAAAVVRHNDVGRWLRVQLRELSGLAADDD
ncbi:MAG: trehalose-6-phosphate synthase [Actinobacteria bacterium]|nr:trehalose-6-phosphate synthase [Actinomycetota bacterium]